MKYTCYKTLKFILKLPFNFLCNVQIKGDENIPDEGPVILAGNHTSNLDCFIMLDAPNRIVHMLAKKELFNGKFKNWFFRNMACIPVDRNIHDKDASGEAIDVLNNGGIVGIFPEGTYNKSGDDLLPFKYGAVSFAKKTGACIVPFAITGKYRLFRDSIKITYGKPYKVEGDLDKENDKLRNKVLKLKGDNL